MAEAQVTITGEEGTPAYDARKGLLRQLRNTVGDGERLKGKIGYATQALTATPETREAVDPHIAALLVAVQAFYSGKGDPKLLDLGQKVVEIGKSVIEEGGELDASLSALRVSGCLGQTRSRLDLIK